MWLRPRLRPGFLAYGVYSRMGVRLSLCMRVRVFCVSVMKPLYQKQLHGKFVLLQHTVLYKILLPRTTSSVALNGCRRPVCAGEGAGNGDTR